MTTKSNYLTRKTLATIKCNCLKYDYVEFIDIEERGVMIKTVLATDPDNNSFEPVESDIVLNIKDVQKLHKILDNYLIDKLLGV